MTRQRNPAEVSDLPTRASGPACRSRWPTFVLGISFGVLAEPVMGAVAPIVMSILVFAGAAQFAALSVLAAGAGAAGGDRSGLLLNARFLPMGFAIGPSLRGRPLRRAAQGQALVDASFALASRGDGTFDRGLLIGSTLPQALAWISGTVVGVLGGAALADPEPLRARRDVPRLLPRAARRGGRARAARWRPRCSARRSRSRYCRRRRPGVPVIAAARRRARGAAPRMSAVWLTIAALCAGTVAIKSLGPRRARRPPTLGAPVGRHRARRAVAARRAGRVRGARQPRPGAGVRRPARRLGGRGPRPARAPAAAGIVALAAVSTALARALF